MKKNLLTLLSLIAFSFTQAQNVPNGGFESWTSGNPDNWFTTNITGFATPITQETPSYAGTYAARGTVVTSIAGPVPPLIASTDMSGNGFAVTQAYATLSFYYKVNVAGTAAFIAAVTMNDAGGNAVGIGGAFYSGNVSSYTPASIPIYYSGSNPVECIITFQITDTTSAPLSLGNYFVVDEVGLSGLASVNENVSAISIANVYPNPANHSASVQYHLASKSDVQIQVLNALGKTVREMTLPEQSAGKHETDFDISAIPAGFYLVRMKTNEGISYARLQVAR